MRRAAEYTTLAVPIYSEGFKKLRRPEWETDFESTIRSLHTDIAVAHDRGVAEALADRDLTERGRAKAIRKVKQTSLTKLEPFEETVTALRSRAAAEEAAVSKRVTFVKPTDPADRLAFELRQREIRDTIRGIDSIQRLNAYFSTKDPEVREALETAPPILRQPTKNAPPVFEPFIDPETVQMARTTRVRQAAPEIADEIDDLTSLANLYSGLLNDVRAAILADMPNEEAQPTPAAQPTGDAITDAGLLHAE